MVFLHTTKDESSIRQVWTKALSALGPQHKPRVIRCDGAGEYVSPKFRDYLLQQHGITLQDSNANQQHQNSIVETKVGDKLVRRNDAFWRTVQILGSRHPHGSGCTVRLRGIGTGISEASKRVPIFPFAIQGGKQASSYFRQRNRVRAREAQIRLSAGGLKFDSIE